MLAVIVGPLGIGVYSTLINISGLFTSAFPLGAMGLNKYIAEFYESGRVKEINFLLRKFIILNFYLTIPIVILLIFFSSQISNLLFSDTSYSLLIILLACSLPLSILTSFFDIYLRGIRRINNYVFFIAGNAILSLLIFIPLQLYFHLPGVFIGLIITGVVSVINGVIILKRAKVLPDLFLTQIVNNSIIKNILKLGVASIIMLATQQLSLLGIRLFIISKYSISDNGIFQSVFSISNNYFGLFFSIIGAYAIPKLSSFGDDWSNMKSEINNLLKLFLLVFTPLIITIFILKDIVLVLLYSKEFISAGNLFGFQLSGDFLKAISWSIGLWLVPCLKIKEWMIFDLIYSINFFLIFYLLQLLTNLGIISISISYLITNLIHLIIILTFTLKVFKFKFDPDVLKILFFSSAFIAAAFLTEGLLPGSFKYLLLILPLTFIFLNFRKDEFNKLMILFSSYKNKSK